MCMTIPKSSAKSPAAESCCWSETPMTKHSDAYTLQADRAASSVSETLTSGSLCRQLQILIKSYVILKFKVINNFN